MRPRVHLQGAGNYRAFIDPMVIQTISHPVDYSSIDRSHELDKSEVVSAKPPDRTSARRVLITDDPELGLGQCR